MVEEKNPYGGGTGTGYTITPGGPGGGTVTYNSPVLASVLVAGDIPGTVTCTVTNTRENVSYLSSSQAATKEYTGNQQPGWPQGFFGQIAEFIIPADPNALPTDPIAISAAYIPSKSAPAGTVGYSRSFTTTWADIQGPAGLTLLMSNTAPLNYTILMTNLPIPGKTPTAYYQVAGGSGVIHLKEGQQGPNPGQEDASIPFSIGPGGANSPAFFTVPPALVNTTYVVYIDYSFSGGTSMTLNGKNMVVNFKNLTPDAPNGSVTLSRIFQQGLGGDISTTATILPPAGGTTTTNSPPPTGPWNFKPWSLGALAQWCHDTVWGQLGNL